MTESAKTGAIPKVSSQTGAWIEQKTNGIPAVGLSTEQRLISTFDQDLTQLA